MPKRCHSCGFRNPPDVGECLVCHRDLLATTVEVRQAFKNLSDLAQGKIGEAGTRAAKDFAQEEVSAIKYRFHPLWILKVKLHRLKQALISIFWFFAVIGGIVIIGFIYNFISRIFNR